MRNSFPLLFVFSIIARTVIAQIPVLTSGLNPSVWDNYDEYKVDTNAIDLGITGAGQTWTVSAAAVTGSFSNFKGEYASSTPYASTFSVSANVSERDVSTNTYTYFNTSEAQLELMGYGTTQGTTHFSDPAILITFPFTYSSIINDNLSGTADIVYQSTITGTSSTIADAYGTLIVPSGTYNVLRVKITQNAVSSIPQVGTVTTNLTTYYWYSDLYKYPLMGVDISETIGTGFFSGSGNSYSKKAYIIAPQLLSIPVFAVNSNFSFYPNPAEKKSNLSFSIDKPANISVSMINALGQESHLISPKQATTGLHKEIVDISNLPKGIYTIRLSINETISQQKIIIQ